MTFMNNENNSMSFGYSTDSIHVAKGAEKHRIDPGQYLGADDSEGIFNQFVEIYDNAIDEMLHWYATLHDDQHLGPVLNGAKLPPLELTIEVKDDWSIVVEDMGRGVPCDTPVDENGNPTGAEPGIFPIFENDSAGGKAVHAKGGYSQGTAGMHGAGAAVSKSCTRYFNVMARSGSGNGVYYVNYIEGERDYSKGVNGLVYAGPLSYEHPIEEYRKYNIPYTGTRIEYLYDERILAPTYNGLPTDPYGEQELIDRIRQSLLGVEDRGSVIVHFTFKGDYTKITPYDITPESLIGYDGTDPEAANRCARFDIQSAPAAAGTKGEFGAKIYLNMDLNGYDFKDTALVNRLKMQKSTSTQCIKNILHEFISEDVDKWLAKHPDVKKPSARAYNYSKFFKCCTILTLPKATFSKQQKDDLKSTDYIQGFKEELYRTLEANRKFFKPVVDRAIQGIKAYDAAQKAEAKAKEKREKDLKRELDKEALKKRNEELANSLEGQVLDSIEGRKGKIRIKHSHQPINISRIGFFEGENAAEVINNLINDGEPLAAVTFTGKLANIYDPKNDNIESIQRLVREVFLQPYTEYLIFTDPDPDGAHIRMQTLALIAEYAPHMLFQERVFVIRAPYGQIRVYAGDKVVIQNEFEGTLVLEEGIHYVNSYAEMQSAIEQGAEYLLSYSGALDVMAGCKDISIQTMLSDPKYKVPIKCPTARDLEYLKEMLTPDSLVKKKFTNAFYTERKMINKYASSGNRRLKIKTGGDRLIPVAHSVTDTPIVSGYQNLTHYNVLY